MNHSRELLYRASFLAQGPQRFLNLPAGVEFVAQAPSRNIFPPNKLEGKLVFHPNSNAKIADGGEAVDLTTEVIINFVEQEIHRIIGREGNDCLDYNVFPIKRFEALNFIDDFTVTLAENKFGVTKLRLQKNASLSEPVIIVNKLASSVRTQIDKALFKFKKVPADDLRVLINLQAVLRRLTFAFANGKEQTAQITNYTEFGGNTVTIGGLLGSKAFNLSVIDPFRPKKQIVHLEFSTS